MDVKAFMGHMAKTEIDKAFKVIEKTLPLPNLLARICDHPCEDACIRKDIDAPLSIGTLERACAVSRSKQKKRFLPSPKGKKVGIWGSGLSSLTAAWDLGLKGYEVIVYHQTGILGGHLRRLSPTVLPKEIMDGEVKNLLTYGVSFKTAASPDDAFGGRKIQSFDAVYLGFDSPGESFFGISYDETGLPMVDAVTLQTIEPKVFAGGFSPAGAHLTQYAYPVAHAAQGRKAATSIDRILSQVSILAGREREGACETRLSTDISQVKPQPRIDSAIDPIIDPDITTGARPENFEQRFNLTAAGHEAERCIRCDCSRCVRACTYIDSFKGFPGKYAREIYNNSAIVMGERKANLLINSCCLCTLCETVCPHDFSMTELCLSARQEMVEKGRMPASAHEFALKEMAWASGDKCFFARHEPGKDHSNHIFFPGCQLLGSDPAQVEKAYAFLRTKLPGSTGFISGCCGAPARWAGREDLFEKNLETFKAFWENSGRPDIITACTSCTQMLLRGLKDAKITSLFQVMAQMPDLMDDVANKKASNTLNEFKHGLSDPANIIDPCTARDDLLVQAAVRDLAQTAGVKICDLPASGSLTECCGFGGLVYNANPDLSRKIIQQRVAQSESDFIAYCAMCRDRLASTGKKVVHLLDLFWPTTDQPKQRKDPGFSRRHDNLALARTRMLEQVWDEKETDQKPSKKMHVRISPQVEAVLEDQYILVTDIEKVLEHFETQADYFLNSEKNSKISFFRPNNVSFWVEFKEIDGGYEILNAWSHRMEVVADKTFIPGTLTQVHEGDIQCASCNQTLTPYKNHVAYLGSRFDVVLPQCSQCGNIFISRELTRGKMAEVEKILEDK